MPLGPQLASLAHEPHVVVGTPGRVLELVQKDALQLRGMATAHHLQGTGLGSVLLRAGCERAAASGVGLVWARARDAALDFYARNGFVVEGEGFIDPTTEIPHHLVVRALAL